MENDEILKRIEGHLEWLDADAALWGVHPKRWSIVSRLRLVSLWIELAALRSGFVPGRVRTTFGVPEVRRGD